MNTKILTSALVIGSIGVIQAWQSKRSIGRPLLGAYVFLLVLSLADMFGGPISTLASALAMLALVYVLLSEGLPLLQTGISITK